MIPISQNRPSPKNADLLWEFQYLSNETLRMRDYDPTTGRYMQADPLGLVDGASVYGYALQNPGRYVDWNGLDSVNAQSVASIMIGNNNYQYWDRHPEAAGRAGQYLGGRKTNKCNMFVYDVLSLGGHPPGRDPNGTIPVASTWGNPMSTIPGYVSISLDAIQGGDIISDGHHVGIVVGLDLSRFDAAPLIAFTATKESYYGTETNGRIPARCGANCVNQRANA